MQKSAQSFASPLSRVEKFNNHLFYIINYSIIDIVVIFGDVFGFDNILEVSIASSGFSLGHFNHVRN